MMHAKPRKLLALFILVSVGLSAACGGAGPPICSACNYKTASYTVTAAQLQGGTILSATMHTEVAHPTCPYGSNTAPCTATLDMDVKCKTSGAGSYTIKKRPNGFSHGATSAASSINLVVALPNGGGNLTVPVPVTLTTTSDTTATSPCGGSMDPKIQY